MEANVLVSDKPKMQKRPMTTVSRKKNKRVHSTWISKNIPLLILTLPMVIYIFIFCYLPMFGIVIAFKQFNYTKGIIGSKWIGLQNFKFFFETPDALRITVNTLGYNIVFIIVGLILGVLFAVLLYEISNRFFLKTYQTLMFIPNLLSWVVVAYMAYAFLNPRSGMLNQLLTLMGKPMINWYSEPKYWYVILPIANLWKNVGMSVLMYYASLMGIDKEYYEAASIEGATKWQMTWKITLPFLYPLMTILTLLAIGSIFNSDFGLFYQLPMNSPLLYSSTDVLDTYVYRALAVSNNVSMSSACGVYKSVVGFILVLISNAIVKKIDPDSALF